MNFVTRIALGCISFGSVVFPALRASAVRVDVRADHVSYRIGGFSWLKAPKPG